jgi:hypothetical protein
MLTGRLIALFYGREKTSGGYFDRQLELSVAGQNLLRPLHLEFANAFEVDHTQVERSVVGKMTWRF